jgi:hypothetical protein
MLLQFFRYAAFAVLTSRYWRMHSCRHRPRPIGRKRGRRIANFPNRQLTGDRLDPRGRAAARPPTPSNNLAVKVAYKRQHNEILVLDTKVEKFGWLNAPKRDWEAVQYRQGAGVCTGGGRGNGTRLGSDWANNHSCKRPCVGNPHDVKATALTSKKPRRVGRIFAVGFPRFVSNKANSRCAISLTRSPFPAGPRFKVRRKRQSKVRAPMRSLVSAKSIRS